MIYGRCKEYIQSDQINIDIIVRWLCMWMNKTPDGHAISHFFVLEGDNL